MYLCAENSNRIKAGQNGLKRTKKDSKCSQYVPEMFHQNAHKQEVL